MTIEEKLEKANRNILQLVNTLVSIKQEREKMYCCYPDKQRDCNGNCDKCKEKFYDEYFKNMADEYIVK